jgi:hypothetical protein
MVNHCFIWFICLFFIFRIASNIIKNRQHTICFHQSRVKMFIFYILLFFTLILSTNQQQIATLFQVSSFGIGFSPANSSDLISNQTDVRSMTRCVTACLINTECYTVGYDSSSFLCCLFAVWVYEGTIVQSASLPTSRIAYIEQKPILYHLYSQSCHALYAINRFLWCINGQWSCPTGQFYNGSICQSKIYLILILIIYQDYSNRK